MLKGWDLGGVRTHAFSSEDSTVEGYMRWPDLALQAVEDAAMLAGHPHKL